MYNIGIELDKNHIVVGIVQQITGEIIASYDLYKAFSLNELTDFVVSQIKDSLKQTELSLSDIQNIGIAVNGTVDSDKGIILLSESIGCRNYNLAEQVKSKLNFSSVYMDNFENSRALGEQQAGAAKGCKNVVLLNCDTFDCGIVINRKIYPGSDYCMGKIGYSIKEKCKSENISEDYALAQMAVNLINTLQPEVLVLYGEDIDEKEEMVDKLIEAVDKLSHFTNSVISAKIKIAELLYGDEIIGASQLCIKELYK